MNTKLRFFLISCLAVFALSLSSCNDPHGEDPTPKVEQNVEDREATSRNGRWDVYSMYNSNFSKRGNYTQTFRLNGERKVWISYKQVSVSGYTLSANDVTISIYDRYGTIMDLKKPTWFRKVGSQYEFGLSTYIPYRAPRIGVDIYTRNYSISGKYIISGSK